jgi:hypothetical protein
MAVPELMPIRIEVNGCSRRLDSPASLLPTFLDRSTCELRRPPLLLGNSVNRASPLHPFDPLRSPLRRFEGLTEVRPAPLNLTVLKLNYLTGMHAVATVFDCQLDDGEVPTYPVAVVDKSRQTRIVLGHLLPIVLTTDPLSRLGNSSM